MFGHGLLIPFPDIDNTEFMLILGANPAASNGKPRQLHIGQPFKGQQLDGLRIIGTNQRA